MINRLFILMSALVMWCTCHAGVHYNTDSILTVLDAVIDSAQYYESELNTRIAKHRTAYMTTSDPRVKFHEADRLFNLYRKFRVDSAMFYARKQMEYALIVNNEDTIARAKMSVADAYKRLGRFHEAMDMLKAIPHTDYIKRNTFYYDVFHSILNSCVNSAQGEEERHYYKSLRKLYRDTVMILNHHNASLNLINESEVLKDDGKYQEALDKLLMCRAKYAHDVANNPVYWAVVGEVYRYLEDMEGAKYCYAMSAILDKRFCNKTYTSLQNLAALLFDEGDTDRAYRYISLSMSDVKEANALSRLALVGEYLPIITTAYEKKQHTAAVHRVQLIVLISVVAMVLGTMLLLLVRRTRKLTALRHQLAENNEKLTQLNGALEGMNKELQESNIIKEVYIGQLFNLCSGYIGQIDNYRTSLMAKVKSGKLKDLEKMLSHTSSNSQLKDLFKNFDKVFLEIFPDFIDNFNSLLRPDEQLQPKPGELLSPELRIYALVRLGINDSTKIAEFLHYSVQTVYNYRQKTRNKAIMPREEFIERVKSI